MTPARSVGILGATSLVGGPLVERLAAAGRTVHAISRSTARHTSPAVQWHTPGAALAGVEAWVALCPLWTLPDWLPWLAQCGCRRLVAVSSMSILTKTTSPDRHEQALAARLALAERQVGDGAARLGLDCVLLRPTMIYDGRRDGNVVAIARFIRRWRYFPLAGAARGLRQPVHAADVAAACAAAIDTAAAGGVYALSGAEPLPFRMLVERIFAWLGLPPRMPSLPVPVLRAGLAASHALGAGQGVSSGMFARMNEDLSCAHDEAARDLGFRPRPFTLPDPPLEPQELSPP